MHCDYAVVTISLTTPSSKTQLKCYTLNIYRDCFPRLMTINYDYGLWLCCDYEQTAAANKFDDY